MKNKVKRTILLLLAAVILFSITMLVPSLQNTTAKILMQGGATGLIMAAIVSTITLIIDKLREEKKGI